MQRSCLTHGLLLLFVFEEVIVKTVVLSAFGETWVIWLQLPTCIPGLTPCGCSILPVSLPVVTITLFKVAFQVKHREAWRSLNESFHFLWGLLSWQQPKSLKVA